MRSFLEIAPHWRGGPVQKVRSRNVCLEGKRLPGGDVVRDELLHGRAALLADLASNPGVGRQARLCTMETPTPAEASSSRASSNTQFAGLGYCAPRKTLRRSSCRPARAHQCWVRDVASVEIGAVPRQGLVSRDDQDDIVTGILCDSIDAAKT